MSKKINIVSLDIVKDRSFDTLINATLKGLDRQESFYMSEQTEALLSKPELLSLVKSFQPEDSLELLLVLQVLIGYFLGMEKLSKGYDFGSFTGLSFKAADLLTRYRAIKMKNLSKIDIPHEQSKLVEAS